MDDAPIGRGLGSCPHVNRDDQRCNSRFSLGRIDQAFCVCFGAFHVCPMYHQINTEVAHQREAQAQPPLIRVTANGSALPLLATGT